MKENSAIDDPSWIKTFHKLSPACRLKAKEAIFTILSTATDLAIVVPLGLTFSQEDDIEKEEAIAAMLSSIRRATYAFKDSVKESVTKMVKECNQGDAPAKLPEIFSSAKEKTIKELFGFDLNQDFRKRVEDLLFVCMPQSFHREYVPNNDTLDFKVNEDK